MTSGKYLLTIGLATVAVAGSLNWSASAQNRKTPDERIDALEATQQQILKELQEIKAILVQGRSAQPPAQAQPPVPVDRIELTMNDAATRGSAAAKVVVVEFSDFECPFCARFTRETKDQLQKEYVDTGKVRYVFKNYPIERLHPRAVRAAEAAECARRQNKFWDIHPRLFANQQALSEPDLRRHAQAIGLALQAFEACFAGPSAAKVKADLAEGVRAGITGTPTFFIGRPMGDGRVKVDTRLVGAQPYAAFKAVLDKLLAS